ncbi:MAG: hypothetical protein ACOYI4_08465 [Christensenellales bacterium]
MKKLFTLIRSKLETAELQLATGKGILMLHSLSRMETFVNSGVDIAERAMVGAAMMCGGKAGLGYAE